MQHRSPRTLSLGLALSFLLISAGLILPANTAQAVSTIAPVECECSYVQGDSRIFTIWWFNGENPLLYEKRIQLIVPMNDRDSSLLYGWEITQGADKAEFSNGSYFVPASQFNYTVFVRSKAASLDAGDVHVRYTKNGAPSAIRKLTVMAPDHLYNWITIHDKISPNDYRSQEGFRVRDQFNNTLPEQIEGNEKKGSVSNDWSGGSCATSNWQFVGDNDFFLLPTEVADMMTPPTSTWRHPNTGLPRCPEPKYPEMLNGKYGSPGFDVVTTTSWVSERPTTVRSSSTSHSVA